MPEEQDSAAKGSCDVCKKPAKQLCSSCKSVFYCSKDCQKRGWKEHKTKCKPFSIQVHPVYGRHMVATRDIKAGEVILKEAPLIIGPKQKSQVLCLGCHKLACDTRCPKCGYPVCGPACQISKYHKDECEILSRGSAVIKVDDSPQSVHPAFCCITALRCLLTKNTDPKTWEIINTLQDHSNELKKGELYQFFQTNVVDYIRKFLHSEEFNEDSILKMSGILTTNSYELKHNGTKIRGLYNYSSKMSHSCVPNTKHVFENNLNVVFISTVKIPKGGIITASYTQVLWNTMARRQHLKLVKYFMCDCRRCADPTELGTQYSTLLCDKCGAGITPIDSLNLESVWRCSKCPYAMPAKQVRWGDAVLFKELRDIDKGGVAGLENFFTKYKGTLHPQNRYFVEAKFALVKIYGNTEDCRYRDMSRTQLENKVAYCRELLELASSFDPGLSLFRGSVLLELQAGIVALAKHLLSNDIITNTGAKEYMEEAAKLLQEATIILHHEPEMRDGGLTEHLSRLSQELEI